MLPYRYHLKPVARAIRAPDLVVGVEQKADVGSYRTELPLLHHGGLQALRVNIGQPEPHPRRRQLTSKDKR
jgi:hypothetical protein